MTTSTTRIAMWSGPRNISTAMMRAWESRPDTTVTDEPLYAHFLLTTGADHPARDEVLAHHDSDAKRITRHLTGPAPGDAPIWYQKHMAHHLTPDIDRAWILNLTNAFLIRNPAEMITSYIKVGPTPTPLDLGLPQQAELFETLRRHTGTTPPVIDAADVLTNPGRTLARLCEALNVPFDDHMLSWPPGPRKTDGVWAKHWYSAVEKSTGFAPYTPKSEPVPDHLRPVLEECEPIYHALHAARLTPD